MTHDDLLTALQMVHDELERADDLDESEVQRLRETMQEIQLTLERKQTEETSLSDRVSESARSFEDSHPVLTNTLGRIADMLQQMGI